MVTPRCRTETKLVLKGLLREGGLQHGEALSRVRCAMGNSIIEWASSHDSRGSRPASKPNKRRLVMVKHCSTQLKHEVKFTLIEQ